MAPQAMAGAGAQATTAVKLALDSLQKALPGLPMGSPMHTAVLKAVADISKHVETGEGPGDQSSIIQQLVQAAKAQQQGGNPQQAAMAQLHPAPPPGSGAAPPMAA